MQNEVKFYPGMDVSKWWIEIALMCVLNHEKQLVITERFDNDGSGMQALDKWLRKNKVSFDQNSLLVIENTGVYHRKQLASYAGAAPFSNTSGGSIKGRDKVHKMANKDLKKLLHMGAISAITHYPEFKDYYERKVKQGKHEQSVINAVRSKIALRAAAVINNQKKYMDKYKIAA